MKKVLLRDIAHARSGDKGADANVGVIARNEADYPLLCEHLTSDVVLDFFRDFGVQDVRRYEAPNLGALNFILVGVLDGGGSQSLRIDAQGKALGQALLALELEIPE